MDIKKHNLPNLREESSEQFVDKTIHDPKARKVQTKLNSPMTTNVSMPYSQAIESEVNDRPATLMEDKSENRYESP